MLIPLISGDKSNMKIMHKRRTNMKIKLKKIKLTEKDRKTLSSNMRICTDSHGQGCEKQKTADKDRLLN
jgi:hypothetical protein